MDIKYPKETSTKVKPDAAKSTETQKKSRSCQTGSVRSPKKSGSTANMISPSRQLRFLGSCEGMNGHIFYIGTTQANRYIKTKKELVGYVDRT